MGNKTNRWNKPLAASHIAMILVSFIAIAAVAAFVFWYALPVQTEVLDAKSVLEARQNEQALARQQYTVELLDVEKVNQLFERVPLAKTDSSYLTQLNDLADRHQLLFTSFAASTTNPNEQSTESSGAEPAGIEGLQKIVLNLTVNGKLNDLQRYLADIHEADPMFSVKQWSIGPGDSALAQRIGGLVANANADAGLSNRMMVMTMSIDTYLGTSFGALLQKDEREELASP